METNNQDQVKDLQYFKQTYAEEKGFKSWNGFISNLPDVAMDAHWLVGDHLTKVAELYAAHRVQQAKDAAFKEGATNTLHDVICFIYNFKDSITPIEGYYPGIEKDTVQILINQLQNYVHKQSPYTTGEKGGEDE